MNSRFVRTREDFTCEQCGARVRGNGYTNHCPACLWSKHVDIHPGDRAATCGGLMKPIAALTKGDEVVVMQRCTVCDRLWRNRAAPNDNREVLLSLFGQPVIEEPEPPAGRPRRSGPRPGSRRSGG